ncbi:TerB family tellurite resistance protein [Noviherbaspirillum sp. CPCC 100848]|uniref:TerB family tellurite resistance protein n=1 Tax=Noviherbaspirillum album TaxID=3080276 RepID=A0ABU6JHN2_9BURK|nr:TerB family tellurite resistance protein [Noviherbaspirillum sp. CPCC 100848]MEC4722800.1 TerB family tellurite resistance protein [Noviherbaspirillum sp. CPCC 100848]
MSLAANFSCYHLHDACGVLSNKLEVKMGWLKAVSFVLFPMPTAVVWAAGKGVNAVRDKIEDGKNNAREEGRQAGVAAAAKQYDEKVQTLAARLRSYHDFDQKVAAFYALGLAVANVDGEIHPNERQEIDEFVVGCSASSLPKPTLDLIAALSKNPPTFERAVQYARDAGLSREDMQDIIDVVANADEIIRQEEKDLLDRWKRLADELSMT